MKPLPFDMTPLARSLSMPSVPRRATAEVRSAVDASGIGSAVGVASETTTAGVSATEVTAAEPVSTPVASAVSAPKAPDAEAPASGTPASGTAISTVPAPAPVSVPAVEIPLPAVKVAEESEAETVDEAPEAETPEAGTPDEDAAAITVDAEPESELENAQETDRSEAGVVEPVIEPETPPASTTDSSSDAPVEAPIEAPIEAPVDVPAKQPETTEVGSPRTELRKATYPQHLKMHGGWTSQLAQEQIHALAIHILARHAEGKLRTLAVTSAIAGEGKTTISLALAEKLSQTGKRILIVDLDAHRATLSRDSELDDAAGAMQSSDPRDPANLDFHVYPTDIPGIWIMPAGYPEPGLDGPPLISPVHIGVLVLRAIEEYDLVVLDCPPLLPVADTHVIGEVADAALLVVRAGSTPRAMVDEAIDEFGRDKFIGAVLNRALPADIPYFREVYGYYRRYSSHE